MSASVHDATENDRFELRSEDRLIGMLQYQRARDVLVLEHTQVNREHRGHGHAGQLVVAALDQARQEHRRVIVVCPFAKEWLRRHPGYADLDYTYDQDTDPPTAQGRPGRTP